METGLDLYARSRRPMIMGALVVLLAVILVGIVFVGGVLIKLLVDTREPS